MIVKKYSANYWWQQAMRIASVRDQLNKHDIKYETLNSAWWAILEKYLEALMKEAK